CRGVWHTPPYRAFMPSCKNLHTNMALCNMCVSHMPVCCDMPVCCVSLILLRTVAVAHKCAVSGRILYAPTVDRLFRQ
ncbi:hypothetical protein, partial [Desulfobacula sp.]|uniref:hypothetical protein n=1 Tax=Desulfobacula sp. TaxID=2593537 RepID=UPI0039B84B6E